jgi:hypothetical protein
MDNLFRNFAAISHGHRNGKEITMRSEIIPNLYRQFNRGSRLWRFHFLTHRSSIIFFLLFFKVCAQTPADSVVKIAKAATIKQKDSATIRDTLIGKGNDTLSKTGSDSIGKMRVQMPDSGRKAAFHQEKRIDSLSQPPEDTTYRFWNHPYWGIGAGWTLGSFPLYSEWENGLFDSSSQIAGPGSIVPKFTVLEPVNSYNIFWPFKLSYTPIVNERNAISLEGEFYFLFTGKTFLASLLPGSDTLHSSVEVNQSCKTYFFTIGLDYRTAIPEEYFKVEGVGRTTAIIGFSITPLLRFSKQTSISINNPYNTIPDSTITQIGKSIDNRSFNGMGVSWKLGISSLKKLTKKSGVEIGISYSGHYMGFFKNGPAPMVWKDLNPGHLRPEEKIACISNTFEVSIMLLSGKAAPTAGAAAKGK